MRTKLRAILGTILTTAMMAAALPAQSAPLELVEVWTTTGLKTPESVLPDPTGEFAYVSNVDGGPIDKDTNGFISKVSLADGKVLDLKWVEGLNGPKGMALLGDKLFVADISQLVEIDTKTAKVVARYDAAGAKFLNDITIDDDGNVYVSDMVTNKIWRLAGGKFETWLDTPELRSPNGLVIRNGNLIVAAWGVMTDGFNTKVPGNLLAVSLADKSIKNLGDGTPVGNLDGLVIYGDDYLATDWMAGGLFLIDSTGKFEQVIDLNQGSADIAWLPEKRLLLVPMMNDNTLVAYKVK